MFGAVPGSFRSWSAASYAVDSYEIETGNKWTIVKKENSIGNGKTIEWYRACQVDDLDEAREDGWSEYS
jgi:hypothetical protein